MNAFESFFIEKNYIFSKKKTLKSYQKKLLTLYSNILIRVKLPMLLNTNEENIFLRTDKKRV